MESYLHLPQYLKPIVSHLSTFSVPANQFGTFSATKRNRKVFIASSECECDVNFRV